MRSQERHRDVGAYALGVLDEAEAFRFEDHLMECPRCAAHVTEFGPAARQLLLYRRATPRFVHPMTQPGPRFLDRLLGEVTARHRARRRRLLYGLAASVVFAVAGPGIAVYTAGHGSPVARVITATDATSGVWARARTWEKDWGSDVELRVKDAAGPRSCRLVAVGRDGTEQVVASWTVSGHAGTDTVDGSAALRPDEIDHYDVRTQDGAHLVTLDAG
ncbi:zf-HC2 domain-containing protein [Streptomyces brasiliensis]|uniref:Membrane protein n=1 Tax=Streptomyces brasiliensis TaxID=1954 RepID=A0A917K592_9ACTN|nr:zf-HC2 domain-containing protein [Streptomyces brasiliensis]GGI98649.1 membrane protein [Streptomyces brasiliensis]